MRASRLSAMLFLLYIAMDFCDPSIPGVFFLDNDALFADGIVNVKGGSASTSPLGPASSRDPSRASRPRRARSPRMPVGPPASRPGKHPRARRSLPPSAASSTTEPD